QYEHAPHGQFLVIAPRAIDELVGSHSASSGATKGRHSRDAPSRTGQNGIPSGPNFAASTFCCAWYRSTAFFVAGSSLASAPFSVTPPSFRFPYFLLARGKIPYPSIGACTHRLVATDSQCHASHKSSTSSSSSAFLCSASACRSSMSAVVSSFPLKHSRAMSCVSCNPQNTPAPCFCPRVFTQYENSFRTPGKFQKRSCACCAFCFCSSVIIVRSPPLLSVCLLLISIWDNPSGR